MERSGAFEVVRPRCAGLDLGSREHYAAAPAGLADPEVRRFGCFTQDLLDMGAWLLSLGVEDVAMEATGVYWVPVYEALSSLGLRVALVDGRAAKALPGRKTDVQDCQWIRDLHTHGLLRPCVVPDAQALELRAYWRLRRRLVEQRSEQTLLMHKALEQMNVQLHKVLSDLTGASGLAMVRAMVEDGERDPERLADLARGPVKASRQTLVKSLRGTWAPHHLFVLGDALEQYEFLGERLKEVDARLDEAMREMNGQGPEPPPPSASKGGSRRKNQPHFALEARLGEALGVDPTSIPGIDATTAMTLLTEYGKDLSRFPTEKHFASHLGLCPNNKVTGGKRKSGRTKKVSSRSATALRVAAQSLHRSQSALGAFFRRLRARLGPQKATTATAHKLAVAYYRLVVHGELYQDVGARTYESRLDEERLKALRRQAAKLGLTLVHAAPQTP